jgi:menaquinone-dependent protoporphyrinogen oxidase
MEPEMHPKILLAYATKHGSTREVADAIGAVLREHGLDVTVRPARDVEDVAGFDGVVLGSALYTGRLHRDARRFLGRFHDDLHRGTPVAVFAMGPKTSESSDLAGTRAQVDRCLGRFPDLHARSVAVFGGVIDPAKLRFPFSHMPESDARDWRAIRHWAVELAVLLRDATAVAP